MLAKNSGFAGAASVFKVFIEYPLIKSRFWLYFNVFRKSDLWRDINDAIFLFFKFVTFGATKCVSIQSSTWILSRSAAAQQHVGTRYRSPCNTVAECMVAYGIWAEYSFRTLNTVLWKSNTAPAVLLISQIPCWSVVCTLRGRCHYYNYPPSERSEHWRIMFLLLSVRVCAHIGKWPGSR